MFLYILDCQPPSPKRPHAETMSNDNATYNGRRVYHRCRNCRITSTTRLCRLCKSLRQCRRCRRRLPDHSFDAGNFTTCGACTRRRNRQTISALYDTVTAMTLTNDGGARAPELLLRQRARVGNQISNRRSDATTSAVTSLSSILH